MFLSSFARPAWTGNQSTLLFFPRFLRSSLNLATALMPYNITGSYQIKQQPEPQVRYSPKVQCDNALIFWLTEIHITIIQFYKDEGGKKNCLVTVIKINEESGELNKLDFNVLTRATICYEGGGEVEQKDQVFPQVLIPQCVICFVPSCAWYSKFDLFGELNLAHYS